MYRSYFHATAYSNLDSIVSNGIKNDNIEGIVYLCETANDCLKFLSLRGIKDILVIEVKLDEKEVFETFDHSKEFFKCKCFGINRTINRKEFEHLWRGNIAYENH